MSKLSSSRPALAVAVIVVAVATGCHPANPIVGKWQITQTLMGAQLTVTREFKSDGTESLTNPGGMDAEMSYSVNGNQLHEKATSITIAGHTLKIDPNNAATAQKELVETFSVDGDKLTITNSSAVGVQASQTFTRAPG